MALPVRILVVGLRVLAWPLTGLITHAPIAAPGRGGLVVAALAWRSIAGDGLERRAARWFGLTLLWTTLALAVAASGLATVDPAAAERPLPRLRRPDRVRRGRDGRRRAGPGAPARRLDRPRRRSRVVGGAASSSRSSASTSSANRRPSRPTAAGPAGEAAAERVLLASAAADGRRLVLDSLPAFKSADAMRFPLVRRGAEAPRPREATRVGLEASPHVVLCDALFDEAIGAPCGGPGRGRRSSAPAVERPLDRFEAAPGRWVSVYLPDLGSSRTEANAGAPDAGVRCPRDPVVEGEPGRALDVVEGAVRGVPGRPRGRPIGRLLTLLGDIAGPTPATTGPVPVGCDRAIVRSGGRVGRGRGRSRRLERAAEAAHPDGEVVLHDLADLRLGQHLVGAQRVLDAGGRVDRTGGDEAEVLGRVGVLAELAQPPGELRRGPERWHAVAADQAGDRRVVDARLLRELTLRHLLGLELGSQPLVERATVLGGGHRAVMGSVARTRGRRRVDRTIRLERAVPVSPVRTGVDSPLGANAVGYGAVCAGSGGRPLGAADIERRYDTQKVSDDGQRLERSARVGRGPFWVGRGAA